VLRQRCFHSLFFRLSFCPTSSKPDSYCSPKEDTNMHVHDFCEDKARKGDGLFTIAFALLELADAQKDLAANVSRLGNGNASTHFGAIEAFGMHIGEKLDALTIAIADNKEDQ
jgi:hypothetical protein